MINAIEINNLCKSYGDFKLDNVSFNVPSGTIMGFIGENGAGKSTTIKSILNIVYPNSGSVKILGLDPQKDIKKINEEIGVVLDGSFFYEGMRITEIEKVMSGLYSTWDHSYYNKLITHFKLPNKPMKEYSRGMRMKLNLAAALAHKPKLLVLDEATSGLDPVMRSEMLDIFLDFIKDEEHSILMSSHITSDLEKVADYITFIHEGRIVFSRSKEEVMEQYAVAKCTQQQAMLVPQELISGRRDTHFNTELLINDRAALRQINHDILIDNASIDDIMTFIAKEDNDDFTC